jgi:hypothetical protein
MGETLMFRWLRVCGAGVWEIGSSGGCAMHAAHRRGIDSEYNK